MKETRGNFHSSCDVSARAQVRPRPPPRHLRTLVEEVRLQAAEAHGHVRPAGLLRASCSQRWQPVRGETGQAAGIGVRVAQQHHVRRHCAHRAYDGVAGAGQFCAVAVNDLQVHSSEVPPDTGATKGSSRVAAEEHWINDRWRLQTYTEKIAETSRERGGGRNQRASAQLTEGLMDAHILDLATFQERVDEGRLADASCSGKK